MNALQRRQELERLARYRRKVGGGLGPESGWIECIANALRVRFGTVSAEDLRDEARRYGLPPLDDELVQDALTHVTRAAWGRYQIYSPKLAGDKLQLTKVERDAAEIFKIDAIDETREERRRRLDRERKADKRAAKAAPRKVTKKSLAEALKISRPTLDDWIRKGRVDPETGELIDLTLGVRRSMISSDNQQTENVKVDA